MPSEGKLLMRVSAVKLWPLKKNAAGDNDGAATEPLKTPWGPYVQLDLEEAAPTVDFTIRRRKMPSEVSQFSSSPS